MNEILLEEDIYNDDDFVKFIEKHLGGCRKKKEEKYFKSAVCLQIQYMKNKVFQNFEDLIHRKSIQFKGEKDFEEKWFKGWVNFFFYYFFFSTFLFIVPFY